MVDMVVPPKNNDQRTLTGTETELNRTEPPPKTTYSQGFSDALK